MRVEEAKKMAESAIERLGEELERGQSATLKAYLAAMGRFRRYSARNAILIALQRPGARHVAGFWTWKRLGRSVRKGERGIAILAPIAQRRVNAEEDATADAAEDSEQVFEQAAREVRGFRPAYVFDVAQTEGKPLPEFARTRGDPGNCIERLKAFIAQRGIALEYSDRIRPAQGASFGGRITLVPGLSPAEELSVLAHEVAHEMLHGAEQRKELSKAVRETEAEAVAYAVCQSVGLDSNSASSDYLQIWDGDRKTLAASLERIRSVAIAIIQAVTPPQEDRVGNRTAICTAPLVAQPAVSSAAP